MRDTKILIDSQMDIGCFENLPFCSRALTTEKIFWRGIQRGHVCQLGPGLRVYDDDLGMVLAPYEFTMFSTISGQGMRYVHALTDADADVHHHSIVAHFCSHVRVERMSLLLMVSTNMSSYQHIPQPSRQRTGRRGSANRLVGP